MRLKLSQIRFFALIAAVIVVSFASGWWARENGVRLRPDGPQGPINRIVPEGKDVDFSLFWEVWDRIEAGYFDKEKINSQKMILGAIEGMVASLGDPYTVFLPPDEQKRTQEDLGGEFEGVGLQLGFKGTQLAVIAPLEETPAERAGVKAGDFILGIKDEDKKLEIKNTTGLSLPDAVGAIRGRAGTKVTLVLIREGVEKPFEVEIVRAKIEVPSVKLSFVGDKQDIAHLQLYRFGDNTNGEWDKAILNIKNPSFAKATEGGQKSKGLILDLRNNPGGYLNGAVIIASEFLPRGVVVIQEDGKKTRQEFKVTGKARLADIPLVVLVNGGSASASEIVAGALRDQGRAKIIGEKTFGKGTIQEAQQLDSSGLHITTARWLTPNGTWVNDGPGLVPDTEAEDKSDTEEDEQLEKAIEELIK
ncbi:MAG: S41 family peptidase [Candidatus Blackburnbacteria bacterium]|nr:S41 family peptidase [Candidatus Blackburnbacteria bacterium]